MAQQVLDDEYINRRHAPTALGAFINEDASN